MTAEAQMIGPLADRAVNRLLVRSLEEQIEERDRTWRVRCDAAFAAGERHGRAAWPVALLIGCAMGAAAVGLLVALVGGSS